MTVSFTHKVRGVGGARGSIPDGPGVSQAAAPSPEGEALTGGEGPTEPGKGSSPSPKLRPSVITSVAVQV